MKVTTSQNSCEGNVSFWNGGKISLAPAGASVCAVSAIYPLRCVPPNRPVAVEARGLNRIEQQQCDQQREDGERLGHRETEDQPRELAVGRGGVADRRREIMAENGAHADAGASHADAGDTGTDVFRSDW